MGILSHRKHPEVKRIESQGFKVEDFQTGNTIVFRSEWAQREVVMKIDRRFDITTIKDRMELVANLERKGAPVPRPIDFAYIGSDFVSIWRPLTILREATKKETLTAIGTLHDIQAPSNALEMLTKAHFETYVRGIGNDHVVTTIANQYRLMAATHNMVLCHGSPHNNAVMTTEGVRLMGYSTYCQSFALLDSMPNEETRDGAAIEMFRLFRELTEGIILERDRRTLDGLEHELQTLVRRFDNQNFR